MQTLCRIELLGALRAHYGGRSIDRFRTYKAGALLAYLACNDRHAHPREELAERFWPEAEPNAGRNSLKQEIASLRRQLEPPGIPVGSILSADRLHVHLNFEVVVTDVQEFEAALSGARERERTQESLECALALYRGPLLPAYYEAWILPERSRLEAAYQGVLQALAAAIEQKDLCRALDLTHRLVALDPLGEESHRELMRLYMTLKQPDAALRQFKILQTTLRTELHTAPTSSLQAYAAEIAERFPAAALARKRVPRTRTPVLPPLPPPPAPRTGPRLPVRFTRFFGREKEIAEIVSRLQPHFGAPDCSRLPGFSPGSAASGDHDAETPQQVRLLTLTGPGGSGKTRLALEAADRLTEMFGGHAWFVPLAEIREAKGMIEAIAGALNLHAPPSSDLHAHLEAVLASRPSLLVLDNLEQLGERAAEIIYRLLEQAPELVCLTTSRARLNLGAEREFPVSPLPLPSKADTKEMLSAVASVALFVDRAQAVRPDFQITRHNAGMLGALCRRLEGIPLALELAAAWTPTLALSQILERLSRRFDLLVSGRKDLPLRHRTLRAAIEGSYELLSPELQRLFARLSLFQGGWTLEAAEAVCPNALHGLADLRARSLIQIEENHGASRYHLMETLREFAAEYLEASERREVEQLHAAFFLRWAEQQATLLGGPKTEQTLDLLDADHENLRAALTLFKSLSEGASKDSEPATVRPALAPLLPPPNEAGARLAGALGRFWDLRGHFAAGREWLDAFLPADLVCPEAGQRKALAMAGVLAVRQSDYPRAHLCFEALDKVAVALQDTEHIVRSRYGFALIAVHQGRYQAAQTLFTECLELWRQMDDAEGMATALHGLGIVAYHRGEAADAARLYEQALNRRRELGDSRGIAASLHALALVLCAEGDLLTAAAFFTESRLLCQALGHRAGIASALEGLTDIAVRRQDWPLAGRLLEEHQEIMRALGNRDGVAYAHRQRADIAYLLGDGETAERHLRESLTLYRQADHIWGIASSLAAFGRLEQARRRPERAVRLLACADALWTTIAAEVDTRVRADFQPHLEALRITLGERAFAAAYAAGQKMICEQAIHLALHPPPS